MKHSVYKHIVVCHEKSDYYILDAFDTKEEAQDLIDRRVKADEMLEEYNLCDYQRQYIIVLEEVPCK